MLKPLINISSKHVLCFASFLVLYQFLTYIANDMIMPGMIQVVHSFHASESAVASSLTFFILGGASLQLFLGPISDCYGRRPVMLVGSLIFLVFTFAIAQSHTIGQFLVARYFEGLGLCFTSVIGYATLQEILDEMDAIRLIAILSNIASLAPLLGPLAGATFILYFHWRGIFILIGLLALLACWGLWRFMPESISALKKDGTSIPRIPLTPKTIAHSYYSLITNPSFMLGALSNGLLNTPCIVWIAISPIIIVTQGHLSVIDYALWQLPIFIAGMLGNWYLRHLTYQNSVSKILLIGAIVTFLGLLTTCLLPLLINSNFQWLMPGLIIYSFGMGLTSAPLNRKVLFSTTVSKGTAYALISMISMCIQAIGVELASYVYRQHNNNHYGVYCIEIGIAFLLSLMVFLFLSQRAQNKAV